jgi:hypothetical protein
MSVTPIAPHRPGTFVLGYLTGDQEEANNYLNTCKVEKINATVQNAFLVHVGIEFEPEFERDPQGRPVRGPDGQPVLTGQMGVNQGFAMLPLTKMDAVNGCDYCLEVINWVFPKGTMIQDLEAQLTEVRDQLLHSRTGITTHSAGLPDNMKQ